MPCQPAASAGDSQGLSAVLHLISLAEQPATDIDESSVQQIQPKRRPARPAAGSTGRSCRAPRSGAPGPSRRHATPAVFCRAPRAAHQVQPVRGNHVEEEFAGLDATEMPAVLSCCQASSCPIRNVTADAPLRKADDDIFHVVGARPHTPIAAPHCSRPDAGVEP